MTRQNRFALVGKSGSGKSEAARILSRTRNIPLIKTGAICRTIAQLLFGNEAKRSTQILDDALTKIDPSIFLRAALREAEIASGFVIDALRFEEDLCIARELSCTIIRVCAPEQVRLQRLVNRGQIFDPATDGMHRSEIELDDVVVDFEISNVGTPTDLEAALDALCR